jgi:hypothetical protein
MSPGVALGILLGSWLVAAPALAQEPPPGDRGTVPPVSGPAGPARIPGPAPKGKAPAVKMDMHPIGLIDQRDLGSARFQVVRAFSARTATHAFALQVRMYEGGANPRFRLAVVEASDLPALTAALAEMAAAAAARTRGEATRSSAMSYRFGSLGIELSASGPEERVHLLGGDKEPARLTLDLDGLSQVQGFVKRAAERIGDLERLQNRGAGER